MQAVKTAYHQWQQAKKALHDAQNQAETLEIERERLEWQYNELSQLHLRPNEWEQLSQSHDSLAHAAELLQAAQFTEDTLDGDNGIQRQLYQCQKTLTQLSHIEPRFAESLQLLASIEAELSEVSANMRDVAAYVEINPNELAAQEARLSELVSMARKYRVEPEELLAKQTEIEAALAALEAAADIAALEAAVQQSEQAYFNLAQPLSHRRQQTAKRLSQETTAHMQELAMKGAHFHIELLPCPPSAHGLEHIQYQVAANKGSALRPLNKVASGGELARISLALQVVTSQYTHVPTLIFDEVDTGIGGGVAEIVGKALRALGKQHQVLAVTHLPQVAACGEHHWQVYKHSDGEQTISQINILNKQGRTEEIARMLGGEVLTDLTRRHAAELLTLSSTST